MPADRFGLFRRAAGQDGYEQRIFDTGEVVTRPNDWHDFFNALVWAVYPRTKTRHECPIFSGGRRGGAETGAVRDALTQFDECGVVVYLGRGACRWFACSRWESVLWSRRGHSGRSHGFSRDWPPASICCANPLSDFAGKRSIGWSIRHGSRFRAMPAVPMSMAGRHDRRREPLFAHRAGFAAPLLGIQGSSPRIRIRPTIGTSGSSAHGLERTVPPD